MKKFIICLSVALNATMQAQKIKVACVGNSVTYGYGIEDREKNSYPARLQQMLGDGYEVANFGKSGTTLLRKGHRPYNEQEEFKAALDFAADKIVIHLGLNDTDPRNWPNYRDDFTKDYLALIDAFRQTNPKCEIWICRMTPIFNRHHRFKSGTRDWYWQIQQNIEKIAGLANVGLIDLQAGLYGRPDLLPDALHPSAEGAGIIAQTVCRALTGDYGGLQMPALYSDNMVLQQGKPLRIAGTANAGEKVTVGIAGQKVEAVTSPDGKWSVVLPPMKAGGPFTLTVSATSRKIEYKNVMAGEVWLCSGQSNMAFQVSDAADSQRKAFLEFAARKPQIRLFDMKPRWETDATEWNIPALDSINRLQYYKDTEWEECDEETANRFSAVALAFGRMLSDSLQVPIGLILNAVGGSPTEAWVDRKTLEFEFPDILCDWKQNDFIQDWVRERASLNIQKSTNELQRHPYEPCYLYESGIQPLDKFSIRGVVWYQGESNAHNEETHEKLFRLLTKSWRDNWAEELPFYYVQLSSIDRPSWPRFRDSQRRMLTSISNIGMAVSSDLGDSLDVHPRYKREVGERLARWALNKTYGYDIIPSGPLYRSVTFKDGAAYVTFDYGEGMHGNNGDELRTFEIAEHYGLFVPAKAQIINEKTVKVWSDRIKNPKYVRYGWQPFTRANLVNEAGLPASTFRSDAAHVSWSRLPDLHDITESPALGVSAPFAGISNDVLLIAGGCNFPGKPAAENGTKEFYSGIYALDMADISGIGWIKAGRLPSPLAYGASTVTPEGLVWVGGNNKEGSSRQALLLNWDREKQQLLIYELPPLPVPMDNLSVAYAEGCLYVAGGNKRSDCANSLFSLQMSPVSQKKWTRLSDFPGPARVQPVMVAQQSADGVRLYLAGGYQPASANEEAVVCTDMLSYHIATKRWRSESFLPASEDGSPHTVTGGFAVASDGNSIVLAGGVNCKRFNEALNRPLQIERANKSGSIALRDSLQKEAGDYLSHPISWYKFNESLLEYNTFTKHWTLLGDSEELARAGAGIATSGNKVIVINGELKPGIRSSEINAFEFTLPREYTAVYSN